MVSAIPMSKNRDHLAENFNMFDLEIDDEMREIFEMANSLHSSVTVLMGRFWDMFE